MNTTNNKFRYRICTVASNNRGSEVKRVVRLSHAIGWASLLARKNSSPLGIWDNEKSEYVHASFLPGVKSN